MRIAGALMIVLTFAAVAAGESVGKQPTASAACSSTVAGTPVGKAPGDGSCLNRLPNGAVLPSHPVAKLTLGQVDRRCFLAPSPSAWWPLWPRRRPHQIRAGFNDMHGENPMYAHWGVDVSTRVDRARVYAMTSGTISNVVLSGSDTHLQIGNFFYYHVVSRFPAGTYVARGEWVGRIVHLARHVHVAETEPGCGLLDPRRPTGPLRDDANTEPPVVRNLTAVVANKAAYRPFPAWRSPDPATREELSRLHGLVDFRAEVFDMPRHATRYWPQQPLMVAALRSWLGPLNRTFRRYGRAITALDGARWLSTPAAYYGAMAHGSIHVRSCFVNRSRPCTNRYVLHVAGPGLDTRRFPNGAYQFCVSAVTIRNVRTTQCWPVRIDNHHSRS
jgi:hypothetical protein